MPELPEVAASTKYFQRCALGRRVASAKVSDARIVRGLSARELEKKLAGRTFIATRQHGKYLFAQTDTSGWLIMHFGMNGYLRYFEAPDGGPKYDRFLMTFETGGALSYANPRMLGWIGLTEDPGDWIARGGLGPSALDLDHHEFKKIFSGRKGEIKSALMNQKLVAGIGNIYADEILFQARIHPKTNIAGLGEKQLKSVSDNIRKVLQTAIQSDGDTKSLPRGYLLRDRRKGAVCPVCASGLQTIKAAGRTSYFCPRCQKSTTRRLG